MQDRKFCLFVLHFFSFNTATTKGLCHEHTIFKAVVKKITPIIKSLQSVSRFMLISTANDREQRTLSLLVMPTTTVHVLYQLMINWWLNCIASSVTYFWVISWVCLCATKADFIFTMSCYRTIYLEMSTPVNVKQSVA